MDRPYADLEGITAMAATLEGMHALRAARRKAGDRRERMPDSCVLGRYLLTEDGRFGELTGAALEAARALPAAASIEALRALAGPAALTYRVPARLAPHDRACESCGRGWALDDCHDVEEDYVTDAVLPYHPDCLRARRRGDLLWWAEDVLSRAGFPETAFVVQPGPIADDAFAWIRLETPAGGIRFGRLMAGFGIEWSETGRDLNGRFGRRVGSIAGHSVWTEPPVDQGPFHVRPLNEPYLVRYLDRLREALGL